MQKGPRVAGAWGTSQTLPTTKLLRPRDVNGVKVEDRGDREKLVSGLCKDTGRRRTRCE